MKYDFELDFVNNNSLTWIMDQIKTGTTVLEFGPATGRLTKFMKEDLGCKVYLAEIDEEAGKKALQYAEDLVVGDVENYEWLDRYKDLRFDHIIFADVLEHLRNPEEILIHAKRLLKVDGSILLSVPNVAHNSVLINLLNNRFEYTSIGLLDNTHIHLFTKESLENMLTRAGLFVEQRYATYSKVGTNEINNSIEDVKGIDKSYWLSRDYGEVYQFVYAVRKSAEYVIEEANILPSQNKNYFAQVFFDSKSPSEESSQKNYFVTSCEKQKFEYDAHLLNKTFRFDPINTECVISIYIDGATVIGHNADFCKGNIYMFNTVDPIMELQKQDEEEQVVIQIEYISIDAFLVRKLINSLIMTENNEIVIKEELKKQIEQLSTLCKEMQEEKIFISEEKEIASEENEDLKNEIEKLKEEKNSLIEEKMQLMGSLDEWAKLAHEKDRIIDDIMHSRKWRLLNLFRKR